ncbi:MAG: hypothetical protein ABJL35_03655, partial [Parasphingorhabdus sp.]|uniref:hypothetical protein n=1 Tax=Parasphingorhabdus sp. TaxID=2709688 RepID=UPI0032999698
MHHRNPPTFSRKSVFCAASTGIAALILLGGLTAHSTIKLPCGDDICNVKAEFDRADVLKRASLIVRDEVVISSKVSPEALNSTLQEISKSDLPFADQTFWFGGDWRQVGPDHKFGTESEIVEHAFLPSNL